jgi:hypothetical protein
MSYALVMTQTPDEVIDQFNRAFQERDAALLVHVIVIAPDCLMESVQPARDRTGYEGYDASLSRGTRSSTTPQIAPRLAALES